MVVSKIRGTQIVETPKYYNPSYRNPQNGTPNVGKPRMNVVTERCVIREVRKRIKSKANLAASLLVAPERSDAEGSEARL